MVLLLEKKMYFWSTIFNLYIRYINVYKLLKIFFVIYFVFHWYGKERVYLICDGEIYDF